MPGNDDSADGLNPQALLGQLLGHARDWLAHEQAMGSHGISLPLSPTAPDTQLAAAATSSPGENPSPTPPDSRARAEPGIGQPSTREDAGRRLAVLAEQARECQACGLHTGRTHSVFARGSHTAELVFVGEGPGRDEDLQGVPFVGRAGQLLDRMIAAMGYARDEVYICNVVKCRPPENRTPLPDEAAACRPFLASQIELVAPRCIVALGKCAASNLGCAPEQGAWRGIWRRWQDIPVMPTYHPAFLLRSPNFKRDVWQDLQQVMTKLGRTAAVGGKGPSRIGR